MNNKKLTSGVKIRWSPKFTYAIGLITTDGSLSKDKRHIDFTSKDLQLIKVFCRCLNICNKISKKYNKKGKACWRVQLGDVHFYKFLEDIGLMSAKSKTLGKIKIPDKYLFDFLRGHLDGDGTFYSYFDSRWKNSFMFYTTFVSASKKHINWVRNVIFKQIKIKGHITKSVKQPCYQLKYAKKESLRLLRIIYYRKRGLPCLERKRLKILRALAIIGIKL